MTKLQGKSDYYFFCLSHQYGSSQPLHHSASTSQKRSNLLLTIHKRSMWTPAEDGTRIHSCWAGLRWYYRRWLDRDPNHPAQAPLVAGGSSSTPRCRQLFHSAQKPPPSSAPSTGTDFGCDVSRWLAFKIFFFPFSFSSEVIGYRWRCSCFPKPNWNVSVYLSEPGSSTP